MHDLKLKSLTDSDVQCICTSVLLPRQKWRQMRAKIPRISWLEMDELCRSPHCFPSTFYGSESIIELHLTSRQLWTRLCTNSTTKRETKFCFKWVHLQSHVAGRLPLPGKNITKIRVHFFETLYSYEHKMSIKKIFYRWTSELPAKQHSRFCPFGLVWAVLLSW